MKKLLSALLVVVFGFGIAASPASAANDEARINLIHGIPGVDVDVVVGGDVVIPNFKFRDTQDLSGFAGQTLPNLKVNVAGTSTTAINAGNVKLPAKGNFSIIAHLNAKGTPTLTVFKNDTTHIGHKNGRLIVRHAAAAPRVDVKANGSVLLRNFGSGNERRTQVPAGTYTAEVVPTGKNAPVVIGPADITLEKRGTLIVYAVGSLEDGLQVLTETLPVQEDNKPNKPQPPTNPNIERAKQAALKAVPGATANRVIELNRNKAQYKVLLTEHGRKVNVFLDRHFNVVKIVRK